jgi:hypothetical protein
MSYRLMRDPITGAMQLRAVRRHSGAVNPFNEMRGPRTRYKAGASGGAAMAYNGDMNAADQAAVLSLSQPMIQGVGGISGFAGNNAALGQQLNVVLNNVGLNTKLTVEVSGTKTQFGLANFFSQIQLTDLSNYQRINTTGMHLSLLATVRRQWAFGAAFQNDSPVNLGSNFPVCIQPPLVGGAVGIPFRMFFEIPIAYSDFDLRGAIYAAVTNATWRLQLTINPAIVVGANADGTNACWKSSTPADIGIVSNVNVIVYQHYLDQIPRDKSGMPVVPRISLAYNYLIQNTSPTGLAVGQDFPIQYANFRQFLSTIMLFNNGGVLGNGGDVNYLGIQVANMTFLEKLDPYMVSLKTRNLIGDDLPRGCYLFDHRRKPLDTNQYGNLQFVLNASAVNAGAYLNMMYEMLALQSQAINAGSLASQ